MLGPRHRDGPAVFSGLSRYDVADGVDSQLATSALTLPSDHSQRVSDRDFATTQEFWQAILSEEVRAHRNVRLNDVFLSEWFPRSPGLYYAPGAASARIAADRMRLSRERWARQEELLSADAVVYDLGGKREMLRGGIGCIRLKERETAEGRLFFMSASTTLSAHQGVPLALTPTHYDEYIDQLSEWGALPCSIVGRLVFLPDSLLSLYRDYAGVPRLYILVSEILPAPDADVPFDGWPTASAAVMFRSMGSWSEVNAAYVNFVPGRNGNLDDAISWLKRYVRLHGGTVITDFDEQMTRFPDAVFSLDKIANGLLDGSEIGSIAGMLRIDWPQIQALLTQQQRQRAITINYLDVRKGGKVAVRMGDEFKNIGAGAVIINRSTVANALNKVRDNYSDDAAQALQELVYAVEATMQPQAIDSLNALNEELDKPQPSKSRLRVWLDAITSALPEVVDVAAAVAKVALLIL